MQSVLGRHVSWAQQLLLTKDSDWLAVFVAGAVVNLCLVYRLAPTAIAPSIDGIAFVMLMAVALLAVLRTSWILYRDREPHPIARIAALTKANSGRAVVFLAAVYLSLISGSCFSVLKAEIPASVPFWLDPYLVAIEGPLWRGSHALFGWATPAIDVIYASWLPVQVLSFYGLLLLRPSPAKSQALTSLVLAWLLLGTFAAFWLSSVGPVYYDRAFGGDTFAGLNAIISDDAPVAYRTSEMLWRSYNGSTEIYAGISAMPSLHVSMTLWLCLIVSGRWRIIALIYFALIWLGSVHLGWHYFLDGLVGSLGMLLIWRLSGWYVAMFQRRRQLLGNAAVGTVQPASSGIEGSPKAEPRPGPDSHRWR